MCSSLGSLVPRSTSPSPRVSALVRTSFEVGAGRASAVACDFQTHTLVTLSYKDLFRAVQWCYTARTPLETLHKVLAIAKGLAPCLLHLRELHLFFNNAKGRPEAGYVECASLRPPPPPSPPRD